MSHSSAVAKTGMLIRSPVTVVFDAFINPEFTTKFWFTHSTGQLEVGKQLEWRWAMYDFFVPVVVKEIEFNKKIVVEWGNYDKMTTIEWTFEEMDENSTYVRIQNYGFQGTADEILEQVRDSTQGFSFVVAGLKALLEHGIQLNLVKDAFPKGK
jgi:uncharacterized protein YndB with AHSA1/START domain